MEPIKEIGAGTAAGIAQVAVGHPFDTVKVRLQTQTSADGVFKGTLDCAVKTFRYEGVSGLYKGAWSPLIGAMFQNAAGFFFFAWSKDIVRYAYGIQNRGNLDRKQTFLAAGISAVMALFVETPVDLLKVKMQVQLYGKQGEYRNVFHAGYKIVQNRGILGLYQGFVSNGWRFVPGRAVYFTAYDSAILYLSSSAHTDSRSSMGNTNTILDSSTSGSARIEEREALERESGVTQTVRPPLYHCFIAGGWAGGVAWLSTYPFDVIRNRMQGDAADPAKRRYRHMWHCAHEIWLREGFHGFFKGLTICMFRAIPVNACIFTTYTAAMRAME
eukprot:CAMPEP_0184494732 /NCGR_PEP_ID=MMETSP0113_2-20130426/29453_1 /TAXON_ID=91329 /ORGANISM="Norrisiella sphaerica, Strain BC52" /LENGTH=328 /DNA_ID=CAMNT_0026880607 /DNA_START=55 /DNA_END=1041 /DNA_ORIENTATION=-